QVQAQLAERGTRIRLRSLLQPGQVRGGVELRGHAEARHHHFAAESSTGGGASQAQVGVEDAADALRIAQPHLFTLGGEIEGQLAPEVYETADAHVAAAAARGEGFDFHAVLVEHQRAVDVAEAVGEVEVCDRAVFDFHRAAEVGIQHGSADLQSKIRHARGLDLRVHAFQQAQVELAARVQLEAAGSIQVGGSAGGQLSSCAHQLELLQGEHTVFHGELDGGAIGHADSCQRRRELVQ